MFVITSMSAITCLRLAEHPSGTIGESQKAWTTPPMLPEPGQAPSQSPRTPFGPEDSGGVDPQRTAEGALESSRRNAYMRRTVVARFLLGLQLDARGFC